MSVARPAYEKLNFGLQADGRISRTTIERYALLLADDVSGPDAWRALGRKNEGGSFQYRRQVEKFDPFIQRLAALRAEKEQLMQEPIFGEVKWMVAQMWREARETGNATMMQKAAEMRMRILERETALLEKEPGRAGKPSVENPQTLAAVEDIKARLLQAGVPTPGESKDTQTAPQESPKSEAPDHLPDPGNMIDLDDMLARAG